MARGKADKEYRSFIKGLITEATGLTYPEGSVRDIDNMDLGTDGSARRRLGISEEHDGRVIGSGSLTQTLFTNNTGGPLSLAPSVIASSVVKSYDGSAPGNGDWTLGGFDATNDTVKWSLGAQSGNASFMRQDLNVPDFDQIVLSFSIDENTSNEGNFLCLIGSSVGGAGQGIYVSRSGIRTVTTSAYNAGYVTSAVLFSYNAENSNHNYTITLTKTGANAYKGTVQIKEGAVVKKTVPLTIGTQGDYIHFIAESGQHHKCVWEVDNIAFTGQVFGVNSDLPDVTVGAEQFAVSTHAWIAPNGDGNKSIQVFQIGNRLFFRDAEQETVSNPDGTIVPPADQYLDFDGVGTGFIYNMSSSQAAQVKLQSAVGFGRIWFTSRAVVPFYAELAEDGLSIRLRAVGVRDGVAGVRAITGERLIRDLIGIEDGLDPTETPGTLSNEHLYNLLNQGWPSAKINQYKTSQTNYPANNQQWFMGKTTDDAFDPTLLIEQDFGSAVATKGRIQIDALLGERDGQAHAVTGITSPIDFSDAYDVKASSGWEAVAFFAGRVWFAGEVNPKRPSCVYFSKTLEGTADSGKFHQVSDPSSEHFNDLLATDGGYIPIPGAGNIRKLVEYGSGLVVLADTGIWFIYGKSGPFTANNFAFERISGTGTISPSSVVVTDQAVFYWAENSIHVVQFAGDQDNTKLPVVIDLGETTVFKYYQLISRPARGNATSVFDPITKKAFWFWQSDEEKAVSHTSLYNRALIFDQRLGAFTAYSFFNSYSAPLFGVACAFAKQTPTSPQINEPYYDSTFAIYTTAAAATYYGADGQADVTLADLSTSLKLVCISGNETGLRLCEFAGLDFYDFDNMSGVTRVDAGSFLQTGDETMNDLQREKSVTYLHSFFQRTETGFYPDQTPKRASGCSVRARWGWTDSAVAGRWSTSQNAYRYRRPFAPATFQSPFETGEEVLYTKLKIRGSGRAVSFRFDSQANKDFRLLGYSVAFTANGV